ncbi:MAG: glycosyltransferase, partial [Candidatus Promineifilaceae bacterium]
MIKLPQIFAALALFAGPMARRAERRYLALVPLDGKECSRPLPSLSIIIPARNEAENLQQLLPTLQSLSYNGSYEIIVVDDQSTDGTSAVSRQFKTKVIQGKPLPPGWLGKPHACHQGAQAATGQWLLFTDADTLHQPDGPARAVAHVLDNNLDGLSLFLDQETKGTADTLALMVAFAGIFAALPQQNSFLNGQYILLRRGVYLESGGFSAVANHPLEDLALGHHLKTHSYRVPTLRGEEAASVRMYKDFNALWQGLVRLGSGSLPWLGLHSLISILFIT